MNYLTQTQINENNEMTVIRLEKEIRSLKTKILIQEMTICKYKKKIKEAKAMISDLNEKILTLDEIDINWFMQNCLDNINKPKNSRKYSFEMYKFCEALYITSPKAYKLLKKVVCLPSKATLYRFFSNYISNTRNSLLKFEDISQKVEEVYNFYESDNLPISIAIDATVATSQPSISQNIQNVFLIQVQPLSEKFQNVPLTVIPSTNGQLNERIKAKFYNIISQISKKFDIIFICSDGDPGTNSWHLRYFNYAYEYLNMPLENLIKCLQIKKWPISDFLHLIKNQRCRLLHNLSLTMHSEIITIDDFFTYTKSKSYSEKNKLSKFNDKLALISFSIRNLQILMNLSKSSHFYYLLPFSLWEVTLLSKKLSIDSRKSLLEIVKYIFAREYSALEINASINFPEKYTKNCAKISFYSKEKLRRMINTIIGLYYALENFPTNLALNRISSHPIENTFGSTRMIMQNKIGIDAFLSSLTRNIIRINLLKELNIKKDVYRKASDAGIHLTGNESKTLSIDLDKIKKDISNLRYCITLNQPFNFDGTELKILIETLIEDDSLALEKIPSCTVSGSSIMARNIASNHG